MAFNVQWDQAGQRYYETGVDRGVLFVKGATGYGDAVAWNGLTNVTESPSGAEATPLYADNIKYLNLMSVEEFGGTIEAYTYPDEFSVCDGSAAPTPGMKIGQQARSLFGFSYVTKVGNDEDFENYGYKIHIVYNCLASPSEKAYASINNDPEAITFSWEFTTTPEKVDLGDNKTYKPTSIITIDVNAKNFPAETDGGQNAKIKALEEFLYGVGETKGQLPTPKQVYLLLTTGSATEKTS